MKTIKVPESIVVTPPPFMSDAKPEVLSFHKYAHQIWLNDDRATAGAFTKQCRWAKVVEKFSLVNGGDSIVLDDEDYATLRTIAESPKASYPPLVAVQLLAFTEAVLGAT